jgi:hypothetical protein
MLNLKEIVGKRYKITLDESYEAGADDNGKLWYYRVPCKHGHVFVNGEQELGVYCDKPNVIGLLRLIDGLRLLQRGDREASFGFHPDKLHEVAKIMRARKRPQLTDEHKAALAAHISQYSFPKTREGGQGD